MGEISRIFKINRQIDLDSLYRLPMTVTTFEEDFLNIDSEKIFTIKLSESLIPMANICKVLINTLQDVCNGGIEVKVIGSYRNSRLPICIVTKHQVVIIKIVNTINGLEKAITYLDIVETSIKENYPNINKEIFHTIILDLNAQEDYNFAVFAKNYKNKLFLSKSYLKEMYSAGKKIDLKVISAGIESKNLLI